MQSINNTKIKYLSVADSKLYKVKNINFHNLTMEAMGTDIAIADVPEDEVFPVEMFEKFKIRLCNDGGMGKIIDFREWVKKHDLGT